MIPQLLTTISGYTPPWLLKKDSILGFRADQSPNHRFWLNYSGYRGFVNDSAALTTSRTGDFWAVSASGVWQKFSAGVLPITDAGYFEYEQRTNYFLNSSAPATQTITIASTGSYTITAWGTAGTVVVTAGTAVGTGFGTATASPSGGSVTINITVVGTIICTVMGSPTYINVENGAFKTGVIVTDASAVTRFPNIATFQGLCAQAITASKSYIVWGNGSVGGAAPRYIQSSGLAANIASANSITTSAGNVTLGFGSTAGKTLLAQSYDGTGSTAIANGGALISGAGATFSGSNYLANVVAGNRAYNGAIQQLEFSLVSGAYNQLTS